VVWSQPPAQAQARRTLDDTAFCTALTRATESVLGAITACDERLVFPLVQHLADEAVPHPRIALVGDALRVLHPLAGMGVNLGFEDVSGLGRALEGGGDPGASGRLEAFARRRQVRSRTLVELMAGFRDVYAWETPGRTWLRNAGIRLVDSLPALKRQIMREALGLGPVARAMR